MKTLIILFTIVLSAVTGSQSQAQVKHTVTKSSVTYQIKNMGFNTSGSFSGLQSDINFDKAHPESSSIQATINAATINSDNTMRDNHLKAEDYFDVAKYPKITMKSVSITPKGGNKYSGVFTITIKNKTKDITVPFTYTESGNQATFNGVFTIKRTDFGIGGKSMMMADDAAVTVNVQTTY